MAEFNGVIDLSHHNGEVDLAVAKSDAILGVIQKATQGTGYKDPTFDANRRQAAQAGLFFGAYHFGTGEDGVAQAEHFLNVVTPGPNDLVVLDFEGNLQGPSITLEEARAFVIHIHDKVGRWPGFYSGHYIKEFLGTAKDPVLSRCWFWLAQYGPTAVVPVNWDTLVLWQYTDGGLGPDPHSVAGVGRCDRDKFNGDADALRNFWTLVHRTQYQ
jgi:lysozyme